MLDVQSAAHAKQVLEGHAMYEGGANVLRLSYSVHRDLNVKNSGDKSRDFSMPLGVPSSGYHQHGHQHHHQQQQHYAPNPYDAGGHAPPPHHSGGQFGDEAPVTGALHESCERTQPPQPCIELSSHIAECMVMSSMLHKSQIFCIIPKDLLYLVTTNCVLRNIHVRGVSSYDCKQP